jgi:GT2 family glycosyltransferase
MLLASEEEGGMSSPRLAVIVLHWNSLADTLSCIDALAASCYPSFEIVIVDNGSTDGSPAALRERYPNLVILQNEENLGYTGGNNVGISYALGLGVDYVLLLNDDAAVAPDTLLKLMEAALEHPEAGFLGPKILSTQEPCRILSAGGELNREWRSIHRGSGQQDHGQFDQLFTADWLSGCALLVSKEVISRVGLLDERFFAYHEDVEWCYRGRRAGFQVLFVPGARVWHPDSSEYYSDSPLVTYYMARNDLLFLAHHRLGARVLGRRLWQYLLNVMAWTVRPRWWYKRRQRTALLHALLDFGLGRFGRAKEFA